MSDFTPTQGRYLAFIHAYTNLHGYPPAEAEISDALLVSPPSVNQMVKMLEKKSLISRQPGLPRTIRVLVPEDEIPPWNARKPANGPKRAAKSPGRAASPDASPAAKLYVLLVTLTSGPISEKLAGKRISRVIEIRGDQTLDDLHQAIFDAFDRWDEHLYEFQFGKRPFDPKGMKYGHPEVCSESAETGNARTTKLDDLGLKPERVFGYWFDFGDDWYHQVDVERIEDAIPTVSYPRVTKRIGKSPEQYPDEE